ncbi:hypothetical protein PTKIN_Ptkin09bG0155400 [Pterospermum kingtungense]
MENSSNAPKLLSNAIGERGFRSLVIEVDSTLVQQALSSRICTSQQHITWCLVAGNSGVETGMSLYDIFIVKANQVADRLASFSFELGLGCHCLEQPPNDVQKSLDEDAMGVAFPRAIVM